MTDKQKADFLRSEGWPKTKDSIFGGPWFTAWKDPVIADRLTLDEAFRIASRRKAQRERAALKRAGVEVAISGLEKIIRWMVPAGEVFEEAMGHLRTISAALHQGPDQAVTL